MRLSCLNRKNRGAVKTPLAIREVGPATVRHTRREETRSRGEGSHPRREENSGNTPAVGGGGGGGALHIAKVWAEAMPRRGEEAKGQPGARLYRKQRKVATHLKPKTQPKGGWPPTPRK